MENRTQDPPWERKSCSLLEYNEGKIGKRMRERTHTPTRYSKSREEASSLGSSNPFRR